jgi:myo-inositol-1(or 4)-monophosphatase
MVNTAIKAARLAGDYLLDNFGKSNQVITKGDRDLATELDNQAEKMIIAQIQRKFPNHGFLAEENERSNTDRRWVWVVDPLDGTHNFIQNIGIFGVSIGLMRDEDFVLGVIYMPVTNELYVGELGNGSYKNNQKISVAGKKKLRECSVSFDSSIRYQPEKISTILKELSKEVFNIRMLGSSARLLSYVADGSLDLAIEFHDHPWDFAAGVTIIKEAGGVFSDLEGRKMRLNSKGYLTANNEIHRQALKVLQPYIA